MITHPKSDLPAPPHRPFCRRITFPLVPLLVGALLLACERQEPSGPRCWISISNATAHIGDRVQVTLHVVHPTSQYPVFPQPAFTSDVEVVSVTRSSRALGRSWTHTQNTYTLVPFQLGALPLFTGAMVRLDGPGTNYTLTLTGTVVRVVSLLPGTNQVSFRPIKGRYVPPRRHPWWLMVLSLLLAVVLLSAAAWLRRRVRHRPSPGSSPPPPPHETALAELEALRQSPLLTSPDADPFYVALSRVIRQYIEERFAIRAPELTTDEFVTQAAHAPEMRVEHRRLLEAFLREADMVKFARYELDPEARRRALEAAIRFVKETSSPPPPQEAAT